MHHSITRRSFARLLAGGAIAVLAPASASHAADSFSMTEIVDSGHRFFGAASGGLATVIEKIFSSHGLPNGYILGEEGGGAIVAGLTYGEGMLYTKNAGDHRVFWQGPSVGWDFGGNGSRLMMLVILFTMPTASMPLNRMPARNSTLSLPFQRAFTMR